MIEYSNLKDRDELVARARRAKDRLDASTRDERDQCSTISSWARIRHASRS